jgi:hypothetical protein
LEARWQENGTRMLCLFLVYTPNEKTGIPLTSNAGYSKRLNLKIKALEGKEVPMGGN